ncbi:hypothetical protein OG394_34955 [Kribbella sp. NBC_01245]|uniref:hypothetical protein n=1 Tax=Kribbella sp. NBC_01245 TaxID=2903578 RepID=UPI002E2C2FEA|nr:hypothetical protein [Kribbella sp. NBC_01245]
MMRHTGYVVCALLALLAGLLVGLWLGTISACGDDCKPHVDLIEAAGTWAGGIGTVVAVLVAAASLRSQQDEREERRDRERIEQQQAVADEAEAERELLSLAEQVRFTYMSVTHDGDKLTHFVTQVINETHQHPIYDVAVDTDEGRQISERSLAAHGGISGAFHLKPLPTQGVVSMSDDDSVVAVKAQARLTFKMCDRWWQRDGVCPVGRIEPPQPGN